MVEPQKQIQLGKQGVTENFIENLKIYFKKFKIVRISVLKSAGHDKKKIKEYVDIILDRLGKNYVARVIGFKIVLIRFRKDVR